MGYDCIDGEDIIEIGLKPREEAFCRAYVADAKRNATKAAIEAGYTENSAATTGYRLLRNVQVKSRIRELEREALEASGYKLEHVGAAVMREYVRLAFSDVTDVIHISPDRSDPRREEVLEQVAKMNGGQHVIDFGEMLIVPTVDLPSDVTAAIKSIKSNYGKKGRFEGYEVTMHDKLNALRVLAEASGVIKNQLALTAPEGGSIAIRWMTREEAAATSGGSGGEASVDD